MLGLIERATIVVSIDSGLLHLCAAAEMNVPVVALTNPEPWQGTSPGVLWCRRLSYYMAQPYLDFQPVHHGIRDALLVQPTERKWPLGSWALEPPKRTIHHLVERHVEENTPARKVAAEKSWGVLYTAPYHPVALHYWDRNYKRTAKEIGDPRPLPDLKDLLQLGLDAAQHGDDILIFTNDDNRIHPEVVEFLKFQVSVYECYAERRCDIIGVAPLATETPADSVKNSNYHPGRNLFAFTKRWLMQHWNDLPDYILGASEWDLGLGLMIREHFGIRTTAQNINHCIYPAECRNG